MNYIVCLVYGIVQGITEFLPVSSSGHLALIPHILKVDDPGVFFDLSMHLGTAMAVLLYFKEDIWKLVAGFYRLFIPSTDTPNRDRPFVLNMLVSTIMTFVFVLLLRPFQSDWVRNPLAISINLVIFGVLMYLADRHGKNKNISMRQSFNFWRSATIGIAQAFAIFPGVSRSGITLTAARGMGVGREDSGQFSFLLSLPIIVGGFFIELWELRHTPMAFDFHQMVFGLVTSFIVGLVTIHFFLKLIGKIGLAPFAIYRGVMAIIVYLVLT